MIDKKAIKKTVLSIINDIYIACEYKGQKKTPKKINEGLPISYYFLSVILDTLITPAKCTNWKFL